MINVPGLERLLKTELKVIMIGNEQAGKTSLLNAVCGEEFTEEYNATIAIDYKIFLFEDRDKFFIWDSSGQERFKDIARPFFLGSIVICIVYSIIDRESFNQVENKLKEAKESCKPTAVFILIGTKNDLPDRKVHYDEGQTMADKHDMMFLETSAKTDSPHVFASKLGEAADKYFLLNPKAHRV